MSKCYGSVLLAPRKLLEKIDVFQKKWHRNGERNNKNRYRNDKLKTYGFSTKFFGWYHFSIISSIASTGETIKESRNIKKETKKRK